MKGTIIKKVAITSVFLVLGTLLSACGNGNGNNNNKKVAICDGNKYKIFLSASMLVSPVYGIKNCTHVDIPGENAYFCPLKIERIYELGEQGKVAEYLIYDNSTKKGFYAAGVTNSLLKESFLELLSSLFTGITTKGNFVQGCTKDNGSIEKNLLPGYTLCIMSGSIPCKVKVDW